MISFRYRLKKQLLFCGLFFTTQAALASSIPAGLDDEFQRVGLSADDIALFSRTIAGHQIGKTDLQQFGDIFIVAKKKHLPLTLLSERFAQGLLKGIPSQRLHEALEVLTKNLQWSKKLVARHAAKADIRKNKDAEQESYRMLEVALRSGISKGQIQSVLGEQQVTLSQLTGVLELAVALKAAQAPVQSLVRISQSSLDAGLTSEELERISQRLESSLDKMPQFDVGFFTDFEKNIADEFDFSFDVTKDLSENISRISDNISIEILKDLSETILDRTNLSDDLPSHVGLKIDGVIDDVKSAVDSIDIDRDSIKPDLDFNRDR